MIRQLCFILFLLLSVPAFAAPDTTARHAPRILVRDTATIQPRSFNKAALDRYKGLPEFNYKEKTADLSWWSRFWHWFWAWVASLFSKLGTPNTAWRWFFVALKWLIYIGGPAALIFIILKMNGIDVSVLFRKKPYTAIAYSGTEENIHEIDFNAEIERALAVNNYRLAVRLLYLSTLKRLTDRGLITWQINKTNSHYISELSDTQTRGAFERLTRQFEYVWYGDLAINADRFKRISELFHHFNSGAL